MKKIRLERLEIETQLPVLTLLDFHSEAEINKHGICYMKVQCAPDGNVYTSEQLLRGEEIRVKIAEDEGKEYSQIIFSGIVQDIRIKYTGGISYMEIKGVTNSIKLDKEQKQRSFQDVKKTYYEIAKEILKDYPNTKIVWNFEKNTKLDMPLIQYKETDWEFLVRLVSRLNSSIIVNESKEIVEIFVDVNTEKISQYEESKESIWEYGFDPLYYDHLAWKKKIKKEQYIYYVIRSENNRRIGDAVIVLKEKKIIYRKKTVWEKGELAFYYWLGAESHFQKGIKYNPMFKGMQLRGRVKRVEREFVYINLNIDENREQVLYPYKWTPITGNFFYCMPEEGMEAYLRFWNIDETKATVVYCVRTNVDDCEGYLDSQKRIFETINKMSLKLFPDELGLYDSKGVKLQEISLKDNKGIYTNSSGIMEIEAKGPVIMRAGNIRVSSPIGIIQRVGKSNLEINQDFNLYSPLGVESVHIDSGIEDSDYTKERKEIRSIPCWQGVCAAMGSVALFGENVGEVTLMEIVALANIPVAGSGRTVAAISESLGGVANNENRFFDAFHTVRINTLNGGYQLPQKIKR